MGSLMLIKYKFKKEMIQICKINKQTNNCFLTAHILVFKDGFLQKKF